MPLVPVLVRMERVGVGIDTAVLADLAAETRGAASTRCAPRSSSWPACEFNVDSPKQLGEVLFDKLRPADAEAHEDRLVHRRVACSARCAPRYPIAAQGHRRTAS